eukprot:scaffold78563_cov32-Attheya_sp.AAC.1
MVTNSEHFSLLREGTGRKERLLKEQKLGEPRQGRSLERNNPLGEMLHRSRHRLPNKPNSLGPIRAIRDDASSTGRRGTMASCR